MGPSPDFYCAACDEFDITEHTPDLCRDSLWKQRQDLESVIARMRIERAAAVAKARADAIEECNAITVKVRDMFEDVPDKRNVAIAIGTAIRALASGAAK